MPRLSAIIITRNEASNIGDCLDSLTFCDERIVVDSDSTDGTLLIAREKGARIATHGWKGFGPQKNYALSLAHGDWVLSIDADERVTPELAAEIRQAVDSGKADGFELSRRSSFCGRMMRHSGWFPDRVLRLFRRQKGRFTDDPVHERVVCDGKTARLKNSLLHYPVAMLRIGQYCGIGDLQRALDIGFAALHFLLDLGFHIVKTCFGDAVLECCLIVIVLRVDRLVCVRRSGLDFRIGQRAAVEVFRLSHGRLPAHHLLDEARLGLQRLPHITVKASFRHVPEDLHFFALVALAQDASFALFDVTGTPRRIKVM